MCACTCTESPVCVRVCILSHQYVCVYVYTESPASEGWPITNVSEHRNKGPCSITREEVIDQLQLIDCQLLKVFDTKVN
jgi:hypothetical protein